MKLQVLLALFLLTVAAFAMYTTEDTSSGEMIETPQVVTTSAEPTLIMAPISDDKYGVCEISKDIEGGLVTVRAVCELTLPTPCHGISYGWVPAKEEKHYLFSVQITERPGVCTEITQETRIENEVVFNYREGMEFGYKINYIPIQKTSIAPAPMPVPPTTVITDEDCERAKAAILRLIENLEVQMKRAEEQDDSLELGRLKRLLSEQKYQLENLECNRNVVQNELPAASLCVKERLDYEMDLERLHMALLKAEETGDMEAAGALQEKIQTLKSRLEDLPTVTRCAQVVQVMTAESAGIQYQEGAFEEYAERLKKFNLALRIANPCDKVSHLEEQIGTLEQEAGEVSDEEAEAIRDKIGSLVDIKDAMFRACQELKENSACGEAVYLRNMFRELVGGVENGTIDPNQARVRARELLEKFSYLEGQCLAKVKTMFDNHPCMAARALEVELERLSSTGEDSGILGDLYETIRRYKSMCVEGQNVDQTQAQMQEQTMEARGPGPVSDQASEVAKVVGELEMRKHMILMDDEMSKEDKTEAIAEIEMHKLSLIKDAIQYMKRAKIASGMNVGIGPNNLEIEGEEVDEEGVTLELPTAGEESIEATVEEDEVQLKAKKVLVRARIQLDFENGMLKVQGRTIKLPDELMDELGAGDGELELEVEGGLPIYRGNVKKQFRLFAIIPVMGNVNIKANAGDGTILDSQKPWWAILAVE